MSGKLYIVRRTAHSHHDSTAIVGYFSRRRAERRARREAEDDAERTVLARHYVRVHHDTRFGSSRSRWHLQKQTGRGDWITLRTYDVQTLDVPDSDAITRLGDLTRD